MIVSYSTRLRLAAFAAFALGGAALVACGNPLPNHAAQPPSNLGLGIGPSKIKHVVFIIQQERSFDNVFGGKDDNGKCFPNANTACNPTSGAKVPHDHLGHVVQLQSYPLGGACYNPAHEHYYQVEAIDGGKMDGFDLSPDPPIPCPTATPSPAPSDFAYQTLIYDSVKPYWLMGEQYALGDDHFEAISSATFAEDLILVSGQNGGEIDNPTNRPWGCDSPTGTVTNTYNPAEGNTPPFYGDDLGAGPFPCFTWPTLADAMDLQKKSWLLYAAGLPDFAYSYGVLDAFNSIRNGPDWATHVKSPSTQFIADVGSGTLAQFTWITPSLANSDHPRSGSGTGPAYVASLVDAVGTSQFWDSTAIFIIWEDYGGFYDHMPPPPSLVGTPGYGMRTGLIAVSPYVKHGYVSHVFHTPASVLRFAEEILNLPNVGQYDAASDDLADMFDFTQTPSSYTKFGVQARSKTKSRTR